MQTATKNMFTDGELKVAVQKHFPNETIQEIIPLRGGTFNTLYQINGSGVMKQGIILKTGPHCEIQVPDHEKNILQTEVFAYQMLQGQKIPIPKIYGYDFSRTLLPCDYFLMERIEGKTWYDHWPIRDPGLMRAFGKYTARMHSVGMDWFGEIGGDPAKRFSKWGDAFAAMMTEVLDENRKQGLRLPYAQIEAAVAARHEGLNALEKPSLVNFDLWAGNIFVRKQQGSYFLAGMIDFERSFLGDPLASFVSALLIYENVEKETAFLEGYNKVSRQPLIITDFDREKMILYQMLMYLRGYSETHRYNFWFRSLQRAMIRFFLYSFIRKLKQLEKKRNQV